MTKKKEKSFDELLTIQETILKECLKLDKFGYEFISFNGKSGFKKKEVKNAK